MPAETVTLTERELTAELEKTWGPPREVHGYTLPDPKSETWRCNVDFNRTSVREVLLILLHRMRFVEDNDPCIPNEGIIGNLEGALGWDRLKTEDIAQGRLCRREPPCPENKPR